MSGPPEHLVVHRELEYLRAAGSVPKKGKKRGQAKKRVKERWKKYREVKH